MSTSQVRSGSMYCAVYLFSTKKNFAKKKEMAQMIKFYVKYHRLDKLFEEEEIFRQAYKLYGGRKTDKNWIAYLHKICRDAYLTNSIITIYEMQEPGFVCVKLGVMATADNCDYVSPTSTHLLSDADLILSIMGIKTEMMTDHSEVGVFLLNLDFQDLPSPDIIEPILTSSEVNLHTQLYQAYLDQKFTDVTLVANNKNFKLHKVVLYSMGGDYFKRLCIILNLGNLRRNFCYQVTGAYHSMKIQKF